MEVRTYLSTNIEYVRNSPAFFTTLLTEARSCPLQYPEFVPRRNKVCFTLRESAQVLTHWPSSLACYLVTPLWS